MAYPSGAVQVTGFIGTTSILDVYATHLDFLGFGGFRSVTNIAERDLITTDRRVFGMVASTQDGNGSYILANLIMGGVDNDVTNNANWIAYTTGGGGGGGLISLTNADMLLLISTNAVIPAQFYLITDATYTDGGVVVQGINISTRPTVQGSGLFLNADYQTNGNYSGVVGFASALGLWSTDIQPVMIGDCVVSYNSNYVNLTGNWGSEPSTDLVNWQFLPKSATNGYIPEIDFVKYSIDANRIIYRADQRGNEVEFSGNIEEVLSVFQWGRNKARYNKISKGGFMLCINSNCLFVGNTIMNQGYILDNTAKNEAGVISYNTISNKAYMSLNETRGTITYNTLDGDKSTIKAVGLTKIIYPLATITYNFLTNGGYIEYDIMNGNSTYINNNIELGGFTIGVQNGGDISQNNTYGGVINITSLTFGGGFSDNEIITTSTYGINILILSSIISGRALRNGYSNFQEVLDLTDPSIWNGFELTIPNNKQYAGEFTVFNASLLSPVLKIKTLPTNHPCRFSPKNGSQCAFTHTLVSFSTPNDLLCDAPSSTNILTGRTDGSDFIEYQTSGDKLLRTNLVLVA
jgi:hypothetical protein